MPSRTFWIRLFISAAAFLLAAGRISAQSAPVSFDALPRASKTQPAPASPAPVEQSSPVAKKPAAAPTKAVKRVDTVRVHDTVQVSVVRVDTVQVAPKTTVPAKPATTPATVAAPFAAPSVAGLFQFQVTGGDSALRSTYRVRRAELKLTADLGNKAQGVLMVDAAKALSLTTGTTTTVTQSSRVLQDAYIVVPVHFVTIEAGQQRLPLSYEGSFSSSTLETIDRALMESDRARGGAFGDVRDLGVAARGTWRVLDYRAGVFNGSGETMNETDKNAGKAIVAQLGVRPSFLKALRVGVSGATSGPAAGDKPTRDRVGADIKYAAGRVLVQAEAMHGQDALVQRFGGYALAGYNVTKSVKLVGRFDAWDPDVTKEATPATVTERDWLAGFTWIPAGTRLKVQMAVVRKSYTRDVVPAVRQILTQVQAAW